MELGNRRALFSAIRDGGIINPITQRRTSGDEKITAATGILEASGIDTEPLTKAAKSMSDMDELAGSITGNFGATLGKVNAASELMNDYEGVLGCFNVGQALGVIGELGQQIMDSIHAALDDLLNNEDVQAALAALQAAIDFANSQINEWLKHLLLMEEMLRSYVDALQLDKLFNNPCFDGFINAVASDSVKSALNDLS